MAQGHFPGLLQKWQKSVEEREGFTDAEKQKMILSRETVEGLSITGS